MNLVPLCFWPGGEAASPDALHPGKALKLSVSPARLAELVCLSQLRYFASCGSRAVTALAQVWGRAAPSVSSTLALIFNLENIAIITLK